MYKLFSRETCFKIGDGLLLVCELEMYNISVDVHACTGVCGCTCMPEGLSKLTHMHCFM